MTTQTAARSSVAVTRAGAEAALAAWHSGTVLPNSVVLLLRQMASSAADYSNLGAVLRAGGNPGEAEAAYRRSIQITPRFPAAHYNLANLLADTDRPGEAIDSYKTALRHEPGYAQAWNGLGTQLQRSGDLPAAVEAFGKAVHYAQKWTEAHINLGVALLGMEQFDASERALRKALRIDPDCASANGNLGALLLRAGCPVAAEAASRRAIALAPQEHRWITNLAVSLQLQGHHAEAESCDRKALALRPANPTGHSNLLFGLNYRHDLSAEAIFAEYRRWDACHARSLLPAVPRFHLDPPGGRRLRVGYVSPDFRQHAVALFAEPVLAAHDHNKIELFCYAEVAVEDATTARFRGLADHWRSTIGHSDEAVADMIVSDRIDVLIDLGGHTGGSRLLVFARKPAPVQIAWLLGHGYTSGMSAMDAFLADDALAPAGSDGLFSEQVIRLSRIPLVYQPPDAMPPLAPLPAASNGFVTFGYFGRPERLNPEVIDAWARILLATPGSHLVLNNRGFQEVAYCELFTARFAARGITRSQLELTYTTPQPLTWAAYGTIDIALDPFPHNAGTTTIEALWQGVPVVSLAARPSVGRIGASILGSVGMHDWVADSVAVYIERAVAAAADLPALSWLRATLRQRVAASPLRDGPGLARCLETTYTDLRSRVEPNELPRLTLLYQSARYADAAVLAESMLARNQQDGGAAHVAGLLAHREKRLGDADRLLQIAVANAPNDPEPHANHAAILRGLGRLAEAEQAARAALVIAPDRVETQNNLGNILRDAGRYDESIECFEAALRGKPDFADAWANLAWVQLLIGHIKNAECSAREAVRRDPECGNGHNNLGSALMRQGRLREAETALRQALTVKPDFALAHSNILFCLNYREDLTAETIFEEYRDFDRRHARKLAPAEPRFELDRSSGRRLRVGYVSPDFRHHAVALFSEPLLAAHDHAKVELFCYAEVAVEDATTQRFRTMAEHWRSTVGLSDQAVADMVRGDQIDVLVDLAGHTGGTRLLAFAYKPAPVQIEFLFGHGYTSGLSAMDAFLADAALAPPEADALFSERIIRLPHLPLAYRPPDGMPPVAPLPALVEGFVTFGYFGRTVRLTETVIATWARLLRALQGARLVLNSAPFIEPSGRQEMARRFADHGIGAERLDLIYTAPQPRTWEAYGRIDIALDPFPHNAGTTTIEALWQGVPVVTLAGRPTVGRFGAAILHAIGLDDWVANDADAYVARAVAAAADLPALARLRSELRPRFVASPLHDAKGVVRNIEATYRTLWEAWCRGGEPDLRLCRLLEQGDPDGANRLAIEMLVTDPTNPEALHVLGVQAFSRGDADAAIALLSRARPDAGVLSDLGVVLRSGGRLADAEKVYRGALALQPGHGIALGNLGNVLLDQRRLPEAEAAFSRALMLLPQQPWLLHGQALTLIAGDKNTQAESALRRALAVAPEHADVHETLGALLFQSGRPVESELHLRAALPRLKDRHRTLSNLGIALQAQGRHVEAETCFREALQLRPNYSSGHSNLLFALNYRDDISPETIFAEYCRWDRQHAALRARPDFANDPEPDRRLRVGYVSPDFRQHAVAFFAEPLLAAHDRSAIELFCYSAVANEDATTARFRALADRWRPTEGMSDEAVVAMVRDDRIDVLVDLAGHTASTRLEVFARRAAPVQVESILGHGYTSGLTAMDAFLADSALAPPGSEALFSERLIRLGRIPLAYQPPADMPPVAPLPALTSGRISFGYFGRPDRLTNRVVAAWSRILAAVEGARLVLNSQAFQEEAFRDLIGARFAAHEIASEQLAMVFTTPQSATWQAYGSVDIALDPFPHNAGTTTIEALWQGVPVVSRADRATVGRFGASILGCVGLGDLVAQDDDGYVTTAVDLAVDLSALAALRAGLRGRMECSPLRDASGLARAVETAYRGLWRDWCEQKRSLAGQN